MNRKYLFFLRAAALAFLLIDGSSAHADSLATTDGNILVGTITRTAAGYTVQTSTGPVKVPSAKVKRVLYDHPPANGSGNGVTEAPRTATSKDPAMLKALLEQGQAAFSDGEFADARDAFNDALTIEPANLTAAKGLGYSYLKLGMIEKAAAPLDLVAQNTPSPDRNLAVGLSAGWVAAKRPGPAVKLLSAYLQAHPSPLDEPVINALGIALAQIDGAATRGMLYTDGHKLYSTLSDELQSAQSGQKRWGTLWLPAAEVDKKQGDYDAAVKKLDDATGKLQSANSRLANAQSSLKAAEGMSAKAAGRSIRISNEQKSLTAAQAEQSSAQKCFDDAQSVLSNTPAPDFSHDIPLIGVQFVLAADANVTSEVSRSGGDLVAHAPSSVTPVLRPRPESADNNAGTPPNTPADPPPAKSDPHTTRYAAAFAIAPDLLVTAASVVEDSTDIQITASDGKTFEAHVARTHHGDGLALLKVDDVKLPCLALATPFDISGGSLTCVSYPDVDLFNPMPKSLTASAGNQGDNWSVRFDQGPRVPGGPLLANGAVVGVELSERESEPLKVPAATLKQLLSLVQHDAQARPAAPDPRMAVFQVAAQH